MCGFLLHLGAPLGEAKNAPEISTLSFCALTQEILSYFIMSKGKLFDKFRRCWYLLPLQDCIQNSINLSAIIVGGTICLIACKSLPYHYLENSTFACFSEIQCLHQLKVTSHTLFSSTDQFGNVRCS